MVVSESEDFPVLAQQGPDLPRGAGLDEDAFWDAATAFTVVFVLGFALVAGVLASRRRSAARGGAAQDHQE